MPQQNGRLNTDLDNKLTSSYYDGAKWHMFIKALNADIEALGSTTDPATAQTAIGLLKALVSKLPSALQNDAFKSILTGPIPTGTNKIGSVDIANSPNVTVISLPALPAGTNKIGSVDIGAIPPVKIASGQEIEATKKGITRIASFTSSTPLAVAGTFESASLDGLTYKRITGRAFADKAGTLEIKQSDDGTTWDTSKTIEIAAGVASFYDEPIYCRYVKVKYTNGEEAQTSFRISGYLSVE